MYPDLRVACTEELLKLDAAGYAIGGLSVGEPRDLSQEIVSVTAPLLPEDRPRYVMGVGMPEELPLYVAQGVDMMDCVLPTRNARNGYLFTSQGKVMIKQAQYLEDLSPLDPACDCYTCRTFTKAYLRHLYQASEILFSTLATLHNIRYYLELMRNMRQAILNGKFPEFLRSRAAASVSAESGE
jgi:queuine tRNA-ribosyltransferase